MAECGHCGAALVQRANEAPGRFRKRRYCSIACSSRVNSQLAADATRRPFAKRFWEKVNRCGPDECWPWTASLRNGYGQIYDGVDSEHPRALYAHRVAWELLRGPIPDDRQLDHICRNRACVNPAHLEPVTLQENLRRGAGFGQSLYTPKPRGKRSHCKRGHPLTEDNLYTAPKGGKRECLTCRRARERRHDSLRRRPKR